MHKIENFQVRIKELERERTVRVYLPEGYEEEINRSYPVLYMHDGHNLFYKETSAYGHIWNVHETLKKVKEETDRGIIVVGIDACDGFGRLDEYSPWVNDTLEELVPTRGINKAGGEGEKYVQFLVNSLKPTIDSKYRTKKDRENTYIAGSSMGGFISLYAGYKYPEIFSVIGAFSSAIWFQKDELISFLKENYKAGLKVYLDIGTKETSDEANKEFNNMYVEDSKEVYHLLRDLGQESKDILFVTEEGANHSEISWERRFPMFIKWTISR